MSVTPEEPRQVAERLANVQQKIDEAWSMIATLTEAARLTRRANGLPPLPSLEQAAIKLGLPMEEPSGG